MYPPAMPPNFKKNGSFLHEICVFEVSMLRHTKTHIVKVGTFCCVGLQMYARRVNQLKNRKFVQLSCQVTFTRKLKCYIVMAKISICIDISPEISIFYVSIFSLKISIFLNVFLKIQIPNSDKNLQVSPIFL